MDGTQRRFIGLDVHRDFVQVAIYRAGQVVQAGMFATTSEGVREFAAGLGPVADLEPQHLPVPVGSDPVATTTAWETTR